MENDNSLRWQKLLWAVVAIFGLIMITYFRYTGSQNIISFSIFPYFVWPYVVALSAVIIFLRLLKLLVSRTAFSYILIGTINVSLGLVGEYLIMKSSEQLTFSIRSMFLGNILVGTLVFWDVFRKQ